MNGGGGERELRPEAEEVGGEKVCRMGPRTKGRGDLRFLSSLGLDIMSRMVLKPTNIISQGQPAHGKK